MASRRHSHITLMVMPDDSAGEVRRIRFPRMWLRAVVLVSGFCFLVMAGTVTYALVLHQRLDAAEGLLSENDLLRTKMIDLDRVLASVHKKTKRVTDLDARLRALTMVSDSERNLAVGPVGELGSDTPANPALSDDVQAELLRGSADYGTRILLGRGERLSEVIDAAVRSAEDLSVFLSGQRALLARTPSRRPTSGFVTSTFGVRVDPFTGLPQMHNGADFSAPIGTLVMATADGIVVQAGSLGAYGNMVKIQHGTALMTQFGHLSEIGVRVGQKVRRGEPIGAVGNSGRSTGPHLHYEVRMRGIPQDPARFLLD
jgi:murein DD-endopeptidase MepM/ murein hydrolase activator NlpD